MNIRMTTGQDLSGLQGVLETIELFPPDMLADMISPFLNDSGETEIWLTCESDGEILGFCYARQEELTDRTWNLLAIGVKSDYQGQGAGCALVQALEGSLIESRQRLLIIDTSGSESFGATRSFYVNRGYTLEARIRGFWADGDDKITFSKRLT